jgi:hypothetical protein
MRRMLMQIKLLGYCDSDWIGCVDMKNTYEYAFSLDSNVFSWEFKKQQTVAQSSTKAEYISISLATSQAIWLRRIVEYVGGTK